MLGLSWARAVRRLSCPVACGILIPQPGTELCPLALQGEFLTTRPPRKPLYINFVYKVMKPCSSQSSQFGCSVLSNSLRPYESQLARPPCPSPTPLELMSIELVMPSSHLILCRPLLLLPPIPPSIRVFSNESTLRMRWPKYWGFSFSISPSNEHPRLISFRMD